jgi:signal transduction histidine kinase
VRASRIPGRRNDWEIARYLNFRRKPLSPKLSRWTSRSSSPWLRDISDQRQSDLALEGALNAARQGDVAKQELPVNTFCLLRSPLNAIFGFFVLIEREMFGPLGNSRYNEGVQLISWSACYLLDLVVSVLNISRMETTQKFLVLDDVEI